MKRPTRADRREAALLGTPVTGGPATDATFVLRLGGNPTIWLQQEVPAIAWGPRTQAMKFKTRDEARAAMTRLRRHGALTLEEMAD